MNYKVFHDHYKHVNYIEKAATGQAEQELSIEEFTNKCETDAEFKKKHVYLFHNSGWLGKRENEFFQLIDNLGGWPVKAASVILRHQTNRACYFSETGNIRDGWNTSIFNSDDYYWWKLSQDKKNQHKKNIINEIGWSLISR